VSEGGVHKIAKGDTLGGIATKYKVSLKDLMAWNNLTKKSTLRIGQAIKVVPPGGAPAPEAAKPAAPVVAEAPLKATAPEAQGEAAPEEEPAPEPEPEEEPAPELEEEEAPVQVAPGGTKKIGHTVDRGETTHSIAKKYGVSEADFRKWNGIRAGAQLARGKDYVVYVPQRAAAKAEEKKPEAKAATAGKAPAGQKQITHTVRKGDNPYLIAKKYGVPLDDFMKWNKLTKKSKMQVGEKYIVYVKK
jgi:LysM repeat protein